MPNYTDETRKKFRTDQLTKARVNDQLGFAGIEDKEGWWTSPLVCFKNRTPESWWSDDPLLCFIAAKHGITADTEVGKWCSADGTLLLLGAEDPNANLVAESDFDGKLDEDVLATDGPSGDPFNFGAIVVQSDDRVRETVSADELDEVRSLPAGQGSEPSVPDWWT